MKGHEDRSRIFGEVVAARIRVIRHRRATWVRATRRLPLRRPHTLARGTWASLEGWRGRSRALFVHLDGHWGAGQNAFLNVVDDALRGTERDQKERRWVIVWFNALEHQRITPRWWSVITTLQRSVVTEVWPIDRRRAIGLWGSGWWWRFREGALAYVLAAVVAIAALVLWARGAFGESLKATGDKATAIAAIVALLGTGWGLIRGMQALLEARSVGVANQLERTGPRIREVRRRFAQLVHQIRQPVAIFVEDLDRCLPEFVADFLEGLQTLWLDIPVTYIVAADGALLREKYDAAAGLPTSVEDKAGSTAARFFLQQTFDLSIRLPRPSPEDYERALFNIGIEHRLDVPQQSSLEVGDLEGQAEMEFRAYATPHEIMTALANHDLTHTAHRHEVRRAAALALADISLDTAVEHDLLRFAPLLPRDLVLWERFLDTYSIERDIRILEGRYVADASAQTALALWIILKMRWPVLAEFLYEHPETVDALRGGHIIDRTLPDNIGHLLSDYEVRSVIEGACVGVDAALDADVIRDIGP